MAAITSTVMAMPDTMTRPSWNGGEMRLSSLGKHPIRCGAAPLAGWVGAGMVSGDAWSLNSISAESAELDVSPHGFAELGRGSGKFVVATGSRGEVARTLRAARLDQASVRLELDDGRTRIRPLSGGGERRRVVHVRPRLPFDAADIA